MQKATSAEIVFVLWYHICCFSLFNETIIPYSVF